VILVLHETRITECDPCEPPEKAKTWPPSSFLRQTATLVLCALTVAGRLQLAANCCAMMTCRYAVECPLRENWGGEATPPLIPEQVHIMPKSIATDPIRALGFLKLLPGWQLLLCAKGLLG
jgi:hypothetical protein